MTHLIIIHCDGAAYAQTLEERAYKNLYGCANKPNVFLFISDPQARSEVQRCRADFLHT